MSKSVHIWDDVYAEIRRCKLEDCGEKFATTPDSHRLYCSEKHQRKGEYRRNKARYNEYDRKRKRKERA